MNAEEEPEHEDYPKNPEFRKKFGPRGVLHSWANTDGTQRIEDTGPLTRKRMETVDDETSDAAIKFIKAKDGGKPFFVWWNGTRMHFRTHVKPELRGISGQDEYAERHGRARPPRRQATEVARRLGPETPSSFIRPTTVRTTTPGRTRRRRRSAAKNTNWEGGWRVPAMVRWPGQIKPASVSNEIMHHMDWLPTFAAAAGDLDVKNKLLKGFKAGNTSYKVYLDGYNFLPLLTGKEAKGRRKEIFYFSDDGDLTALRYQDWKLIFMEQKAQGTFRVWMEPFVPLRVALIENLRRDPYERATITSNTYYDWQLDRVFLLVPAQSYFADFLQTFKEFPPRQKAASFSLDQVMEKMTSAGPQ